MSLDCAVQGHGEVILRGELRALIESDLNYLARIKEKVGEFVAAGASISALNQIGIESCGKSRLPLNGFVSDLHQANLRQLYQLLSNGQAPEG
jgi:cyclase